MMAKRIFAALLALCLLGANALAAGIFDDPDAMIEQYNQLIEDSAIRDALELRKYDDDGDYLNAGGDVQIMINEYCTVVYSLPGSGASNMPMVYLAAVIEANEPAVEGFEDWANVAWWGTRSTATCSARNFPSPRRRVPTTYSACGWSTRTEA